MNISPMHLQISRPKGVRYAISDIHGCNKTFIALLNKIGLSKDDQLFILGDSINRGKRSKGVVKTIIQLQADGYQVFPIRGNHEDYLAEAIETAPRLKLIEIISRIGLLGIVDNFGNVKPKYKTFFLQLPCYIESDNLLLVHAGFDFANNPFANVKAMLNIRTMSVDMQILGNRHVIHGHTPVSEQEIRMSIAENKPTINIDNGCVFANVLGKGSLACLNLDTFELHLKKNID